MKVENIVFYKNLPFIEYLKMPGNSYSSIKNEGRKIEATAKMRLGTLVHTYLLTPAEYSYELYVLVRPLALALKQQLGPLLKYLIPELGITADFIHDGFCMAYKGRLDLSVPGRIVIDIKVTELDIDKAIAFFGYDKQQSGYALGIKAKTALIISIHPVTFKIQIKNIPISDEWWNYQIIQKGKALI